MQASASGGSASLGYQSAKLDTAQVNEQTGIHIGKEGMDVKVKGYTQLDGAVITSEADKENNHFSTQSIASQDIENHSEMKVESVSAGISSNMASTMMSAVGSALSALGNVDKAQKSTTHSAVGENIELITQTGSVSRDTTNTNEKLTPYSKTDIDKYQENQEVAGLAGQLGSTFVGNLAQKMKWEDGSPQKVALHGAVGLISAGLSHGNLVAGATAGATAEYLNTQVVDYLSEKVKRQEITDEERKAIQQATAASMGTLVGAVIGGNRQTATQGGVTALNAEKYNRQLHPDEMKWIKENAAEFARKQGISVEEAEKRLSQQAEKDLDILWFLKLDSSTDDKAEDFLASQNNATFIDSNGDIQHYFIAKDNDLWTPRKYASDAYDYMQATGDNFYGRNLQTDTTILGGAKDKLGQVYDHVSENKLETAKAIGNSIIDSLEECGSDIVKCSSDVIQNIWTTGSSSTAEIGKNLVLTDQDKINALYGQDVEKEMVLLSSTQFATTLSEALGIGKALTKVGKATIHIGTKKPIKEGVNSAEELTGEKPHTETAPDTVGKTCSFRGDMEVKTEQGYKPISAIKIGDKVFSKNELTGLTTYQRVQAHYSNPYDYTVYVEIINDKGKQQTIVSNKIHPFFTQVLQGNMPKSSEGHNYQGDIAKAQWIDAQHLKQGYRLLSENGQWQTVSKVTIKTEKLQAYNMTVDKDHTYFIKGAQADSQGVWVHNDCWHSLPSDAVQVEDIDGYKAYQFTDPKDGTTVTVVQKGNNRFETQSHQDGVDPHFNRVSQQIDAETGRYLSTGNAVDGLYNRAYLRSATLKQIFDGYQKLPNGDYYNATLGKLIKGPIDIGHAYGWEHRRLSLAAKELDLTQAQFNDYVNARSDIFRLENMSENRSHKNEMPGKNNIERIKDDMRSFLEEKK